jgi:cytochrome b561
MVIALHIVAAIWHHWFKRDEVMARMAPRLARIPAKRSDV